jgi:hypothetical protein
MSVVLERNSFKESVKSNVEWLSGTLHTIEELEADTDEEIGIDTREFPQTLGYFVGIDSDARCLTLNDPHTGAEIKCYYSDKIDVECFRDSKELIQVEGNITYAENQITPKEIPDVKDVRILNLSDFVVKSFECDGKKIRFKKPLVLTPHLIPEPDEAGYFITMEAPEIGIDVIGQTRAELWDELLTDLEHKYEYFAQLPDKKLCEQRIKHKHNLLANIEEN